MSQKIFGYLYLTLAESLPAVLDIVNPTFKYSPLTAAVLHLTKLILKVVSGSLSYLPDKNAKIQRFQLFTLHAPDPVAVHTFVAQFLPLCLTIRKWSSYAPFGKAKTHHITHP